MKIRALDGGKSWLLPDAFHMTTNPGPRIGLTHEPMPDVDDRWLPTLGHYDPATDRIIAAPPGEHWDPLGHAKFKEPHLAVSPEDLRVKPPILVDPRSAIKQYPGEENPVETLQRSN